MKKFGEFILKYKIVLIILIIVLTVISFRYVPRLQLDDDETTWFSSDDPILIAYNELQDTFIGSDFVIVAYESTDILSEPEITYLAFLTEKLENVPNVTDVSSLTTVEDIVGTEEGMEIKPLIEKTPATETEFSSLQKRIDLNPFYRGNLISNDAGTIGIVLEVDLAEEDEKSTSELSRETASSLREILHGESEKTGRTFYLGGSIITDAEIDEMMEKDISLFFPLAMALAALVLLVLFRSITCILFPILTVFLALTWTLAFKGMVNSPITPVSTTLFALITIIGIADSVHLISHYRIELPLKKDKKKALLEAYQRAGKPCLFTSITTSIGFGSLIISDIPAIRSLGFFAGFGIMSAFILSMILVPLGLLLTKSKPKAIEPIERKGNSSGLFAWIGAFNLKHPKSILITGLLVVIIMGIGITKIRVEPSMLEYLKKKTLLRQDAEFLDERLSGISSIEVVIHGDEESLKEPAVLKDIESLQELVESHPNIPVSYSIVTFVKLINRALHSDNPDYYRIPETREAVAQSLLLYEMSGGSELEDYATLNYDTFRVSMRTRQMKQEERRKLIEDIAAFAEQNLGQFKVDITGFDHLVHKVTERITVTQIQSLGLAFLVILVLMFMMLGLRGGLLSMVPNIFPIVFVLGLMGYAGFHLNIATAIIASIAIGIVVDDTIHYFTHFKHEFQEAGERKAAMLNALHKVGPALCFTSLILVLGYIIFLLSETRILMDFGILSSIAVITALVGDLFIGPTLLVKFNIFRK